LQIDALCHIQVLEIAPKNGQLNVDKKEGDLLRNLR
jgi:hypothetical protein